MASRQVKRMLKSELVHGAMGGDSDAEEPPSQGQKPFNPFDLLDDEDGVRHGRFGQE